MKLVEKLQRNTVGADARRANTRDVEQFLKDTWQRTSTGEHFPGEALAVVGSFSRGEGGPHSDIDVVVLLPNERQQAALTDFVQQLWDGGLGVDHSTRTAAQCVAIAKTDLPALTGLLSLRHVVGEESLSAEVAEAVNSEYRKSARTRVGELLEDARNRWRTADRLHRLNEPDLKNSAGGLRDVDLLRALAASWLADYDHKAVEAATETLLDARDALHLAAGRHVSQLLRPYQADVAGLLGYGGESPETDMMRELRLAAAQVERNVRQAASTAASTQSSWGLARRIFRPRAPRGGVLAPVGASTVGEGLLSLDGELSFLQPRDARDVDAVLHLAVESARRSEPISEATLVDIAEAPAVGPHQWTPARLERFIQLLSAGPGLRGTWAQLDSAGWVPGWIPAWTPLRGRPQSASFHRWTVDRHLIETVVYTNEILTGVAPFFGGTAPTDLDPTVAYLAALLHDLGKQPPDGGVNHAVHGAQLAAPFLAQLPLTADQRETLEMLIRHHLVLAELAIDHDPSAPETLQALLDACGARADRLHHLAVLTVADSRGAGPKAWTPWREALIGELYAAAAFR